MEPEKVKKHPLKKFLSLFLKSDLPTVKRHFLMDVMVPKITELIVDGVKETADVLFYGESAPSKPKRSGTYVSYNNYSTWKCKSKFLWIIYRFKIHYLFS